MIEQKPKKCKACNKDFMVRVTDYNRRIYCSMHCSKSGKSNPNFKNSYRLTDCDVCGFPILKYRSQRKHTCSKGCADIMRKFNSTKNNLGLNIHNCDHLKRMSEQRKGVPRTKKAIKAISAGVSEWLMKTNFQTRYQYKGIKMRSSWEVKVAKYFDYLGYNWKYEPDRIYLEKLNSYYIPDFYVENLKSYVEVKGWMNDRSILKIRECKKIHPLIVIGAKEMIELNLISKVKIE